MYKSISSILINVNTEIGEIYKEYKRLLESSDKEGLRFILVEGGEVFFLYTFYPDDYGSSGITYYSQIFPGDPVTCAYLQKELRVELIDELSKLAWSETVDRMIARDDSFCRLHRFHHLMNRQISLHLRRGVISREMAEIVSQYISKNDGMDNIYRYNESEAVIEINIGSEIWTLTYAKGSMGGFMRMGPGIIRVSVSADSVISGKRRMVVRRRKR